MHGLKPRALSAQLLGLVLGLSATMVGTAHAANTITTSVSVPSPTSGPDSASSQVTNAATCSSGFVSGGGARVYVGSGSIPNGLHLNGTLPSTDGSNPSGNNDASPAHWLAYGGAGGQAPSNAETQSFATCISGGLSNATKVVETSVSGPNGTDVSAVATAQCPSNYRMIGGGAAITPGTVGGLKISGSFPSNSSGHAALNGTTNPDSWTGVGLDGGSGGTGNTTYAWAICYNTNNSPVNTVVVNSEASGPTAASSSRMQTESCTSAQGTATGGGAFISGGVTDDGGHSYGTYTLPGSQGDHLISDMPSDSSGNPVTNGASSPASWTATTHTGGASSANTYTDAWALCSSNA